MKLIDGTEKEIVMDEELQEHFSNPYNYTKEIMEQFDHNYYKGIITKDDKVILEIGGNIGLFSLHVSPFAKRIVSVEPTPTHFTKLRKITDQIIGTRFDLENSALSNHTGTTKFYWCGINTTMCSLQDRFDRSFDVPCISLPDLLDKYKLDHVDFMKVDCEGSEHTAITTDVLLACKGRIKRVFIELHPPDSETQDKFKAIFEAAGYTVKKYVHDSLICEYAG